MGLPVDLPLRWRRWQTFPQRLAQGQGLTSHMSHVHFRLALLSLRQCSSLSAGSSDSGFPECSTGFFEAALSRGYCASYDGPDEDLLSCSSDSDFTHEAGTLGMLASCHIDTWPEPLRNCARLAPSKCVGLSARRAMLASRTAEALALAAPVLRIGILLQPSVIDGRDHFSPV